MIELNHWQRICFLGMRCRIESPKVPHFAHLCYTVRVLKKFLCALQRRWFDAALLPCLFAAASCTLLTTKPPTNPAPPSTPPGAVQNVTNPSDPVDDPTERKLAFDPEQGLCGLRYTPADKLTNEVANYRRQEQLLNSQVFRLPLITYDPVNPKKTRVVDLGSIWRQKSPLSLLVLVLWSADCKPCLQGLPKLQGTLTSLNKNPKVRVMTLSESDDQGLWQKTLAEQKKFWATTQHGYILPGGSGATAFCSYLGGDRARPLVIALDRNWVVRQALVYPFDDQRQRKFLQVVQNLTSSPKASKAAAIEGISRLNTTDPTSLLASQTGLLGYRMTDVVSALLPPAQGKPVSLVRGTGPQIAYFSPQNNLDTDPERQWIEKELVLPRTNAAFSPHERITFQWFSAPKLSRPLLLVSDGTGLVRRAVWGPMGRAEKNALYLDIDKIAQTMKPAPAPPPSSKTKPTKRKK